MSKNLLLIFTRNPQLGKCKTRLAKDIGAPKALDVYNFLIEHTQHITKSVNAARWVLYSEYIPNEDGWNSDSFTKKLQVGNDLGHRMENAFKSGFNAGYKRIIIIGSDMFDLSTLELNAAFELLSSNDAVIGPALDGGYYLLGIKHMVNGVFAQKQWGTSSVYQNTLEDLKDLKLAILPQKNDIDVLDDIKDIPTFQQFLQT